MFKRWIALFKPWGTLLHWLRRYCRSYGGIRGVLTSPFFGLALLITGLSYSQWLTPEWIDKAEALVPSLLGFSLGTYAILFGIMSGRLKGALRHVKSTDGISYLERINAIFFHFIFIQVICLIWAFMYQGRWLVDLASALSAHYEWIVVAYGGLVHVGSFVGCFLLVYSMLLMIAAALAIYRLALINDPAEGRAND